MLGNRRGFAFQPLEKRNRHAAKYAKTGEKSRPLNLAPLRLCVKPSSPERFSRAEDAERAEGGLDIFAIRE
jgi:hypothetical protein